LTCWRVCLHDEERIARRCDDEAGDAWNGQGLMHDCAILDV
jgi:hypothetical protein